VAAFLIMSGKVTAPNWTVAYSTINQKCQAFCPGMAWQFSGPIKATPALKDGKPQDTGPPWVYDFDCLFSVFEGGP
jgi:hypothetical protein